MGKENQPQRRKPRGQQGDRNEKQAPFHDRGGFQEHISKSHPLGADFDDKIALGLHTFGRSEIPDNITDANRLGKSADPARRDRPSTFSGAVRRYTRSLRSEGYAFLVYR